MPFDSHIHLGRLPHPRELALILAESGYAYNAVACEPEEWESQCELWQNLDLKGKGCNLAFGIHPMSVGHAKEGYKQELRKFLERNDRFQVGETGLDRRFPEYGPGELQEQWFRYQAELALELGRDLQIHCVGDYGRVFSLLKQTGFGKNPNGPQPIFHRFGGDIGIARQILDMGGLISVHPSTLVKKSSRLALAEIPKENLLFETDADESFWNVADSTGTPATVAESVARRLWDTLRDVRKATENI